MKTSTSLPVGRPFCPWLFRATRDLSIAVRRRRAGLGEATTPGPARQRAFLAALSDLTPDEQLILALRVGERLSYQEIGATCELPPRTVLARVAWTAPNTCAPGWRRAREAAGLFMTNCSTTSELRASRRGKATGPNSKRISRAARSAATNSRRSLIRSWARRCAAKPISGLFD